MKVSLQVRIAIFPLFVALAMFLPAGGRAAEQDSAPAVQADHELLEAFAHGDKAAAGNLLDLEFTATDRAGRTRSTVEILSVLGPHPPEVDTDLHASGFGDVVLIRGIHQVNSQAASVRFARIWVRRPAGWRLFVYQETTKAETTPAVRGGFGSPSGGAPVDCENPCKTVPYDPEGASQREVVSMWQAVERTVLTNDVEAWIPNFTDDFVFVTPDGGTPLNKADRIAMIKELKRTNTTLIPARVLSMKVWVFGDTAVMRSEHKGVRGKTLHITRIFSKRSGHWQIAFGQQTVIEE